MGHVSVQSNDGISWLTMIFGGNPTIVEPELKLPSLPADSVNTGNNTLKMATEAEAAGDYSKALILINEAIEQGISADWTFGQAFAYNMRGTYKYVGGYW